MIQKWTGHESRVLRQAMRLSQRDFANDLGVSAKSVSNWEAGGAKFVQRPESQAILDTKLQQVPNEVRTRFELILATASADDHTESKTSETVTANEDSGEEVGESYRDRKSVV